jgi:hypothetical protein
MPVRDKPGTAPVQTKVDRRKIVPPPEPPQQVHTDNEFSEKEVCEVERKNANKIPPPGGKPA